jgi:D,D-heptose 1,7-bisphosphate phosphatase
VSRPGPEIGRAIQSSTDVPLRPAVFLDRDGTIIDDIGYLDRVDDVVIYPWSADALRLLKRGGFAIVVVTNQSGVARGLYPESAVHDVHAYLTEALGRGGAVVDGWYHCPHHADAVDPAYRLECDCRKPKPGMLTRAAAELGLDLARRPWSAIAGATSRRRGPSAPPVCWSAPVPARARKRRRSTGSSPMRSCRVSPRR